ncbi:MAG: ThiF family adenylyltransferase [Planctomycetes bacterium]|nr:ThiF family adenylyltransferase [Planctomycetota bacterium]
MAAFTEEQIRRYSRHILLPEVGGKGQRRLLAARVRLLEARGPLAVAAGYLAAAGVGRLDLCDEGAVEPADLGGSMFLAATDVGRSRAEALRDFLVALNPEVRVGTPGTTASAAAVAWADIDVVLAGGAGAAQPGVARPAPGPYRPVLLAHVEGPFGFLVTLLPGSGACPSCAGIDLRTRAEAARWSASFPVEESSAPVWGPVAGLIGSLAAVETVKCILGKGELNPGMLLVHDAREGTFDRVALESRPGCAACGPAGRLQPDAKRPGN